MKRFLTLLVAVLLLLGSCSEREAVRIIAEEALPIQRVIDGIINCDAELWRSAFLPAYDAAMEAQELELTGHTDYNVLIRQKLEVASDVREVNYGKGVIIELTDVTVKMIEMADKPDLFADYKDIFTLKYRLDLDSIEAVAEISGTLTISGSSGTHKSDAVYITVRYNGVWYLHPTFYNLMF